MWRGCDLVMSPLMPTQLVGEAGLWVPGCPGWAFLPRGALIMPLTTVERRVQQLRRGLPPAGVQSADKPHEIPSCA